MSNHNRNKKVTKSNNVQMKQITKRWYLLLRRRWHICSWLLVLLRLLRCLALHLPGDVVFLDEGPINRRLDDLVGLTGTP